MTNTNSTITYADLYNFIIAQESIPQQYRDKAQDALNSLQKKSSKNDKNKQETAKRREVILDFLATHEGVFTRDEVAQETELTPNQVSSGMATLIKEGKCFKDERKEKGKGKKIVYGFGQPTENEDEEEA